MQIPEVSYRSLFKESFISTKYSDFYNELMNMYDDSSGYNEKLYRYLHGIECKPTCPVCGSPIPYRHSPAGYGKYCNSICMGLSKERQDKIAQTKSDRYGSSTYNNSKQATETMNSKYGGRGLSSDVIKKKIENTCIYKFGVDNVFRLQEIQDKCCETKSKKYNDPHYSNQDKRRLTNIEKYGCENPMQNDEVRTKFINTMMDKYGVPYPMYNLNSVKKLSSSLINAHANGKYDVSGKKKQPSKIERNFKEYLDQHNIKYIFQYRSNTYPYLCDFYIPMYDLYIEIHGHWTHGSHPFDPTDPRDMKMLDYWKNKDTDFYKQAIYVWTVLDKEKRSIAIKNNLNFLEIYSIDINECIELFQVKINELISGKKSS